MNKRPKEITREFQKILDNNLEKIVSGETDMFLEMQDVANIMHIHPTHLSNTIKEVTGMAPCDICNEKTVHIAKQLLLNSNLSIALIAQKLTFEPTNFTKYFKKHTGETPTEFRKKQNI